MRLGRVGREYPPSGALGHEWKSAPNHWLPTKDWVWGLGVPSWLAKVRG